MKPMSAYQTSRVNGASPAALVVMLYDRLLGCMREGRTALENGRSADAQLPLLRAERIVGELMGALNPEGGELAENLRNLYVHCIARMEKSKTEKNASLLDSPLAVIADLRDAWVGVSRPAESVSGPAEGERLLLAGTGAAS